jgi:hypothetical protein
MIAKRTFVCLLALFGLYLASPSFAQNSSAGQLITVESRAGVKISYWWMPHPNATQTVLLFSGGGGGMGYRDGQPQSENFLVRSRAMFQSQGFNVAILGNPTDMPDMAQPPFTWRQIQRCPDVVCWNLSRYHFSRFGWCQAAKQARWAGLNRFDHLASDAHRRATAEY